MIAAVVLWAVLRGPGGVPSGPPSDAEDPFRAESHWAGTFRFLPAGAGEPGDVRLDVTDRTGADFRGVYTTESGNYVLHVRGTAAGGEVRWEFTEALKLKEKRDIVGNARVEGTYAGGTMKVMYRERKSPDRAEMTLHREE
jgi:hypothetical protein